MIFSLTIVLYQVDFVFNLPTRSVNRNHYWLQLPWEVQEKQIHFWLEQFNDIKRAVMLFLNTIRDSATSEHGLAEKGFYHTQLNTTVPCQLIRVALKKNQRLFREISVGKNHVSIRFLIPNLETRPKQTDESVSFELSCCAI